MTGNCLVRFGGGVKHLKNNGDCFSFVNSTQFVLKISSNVHNMQTGYIFHSTLIILIGVTLFLSLREVWCVFEFFIDYRFFILMIMLSLFLFNSVDNKNKF